MLEQGGIAHGFNAGSAAIRNYFKGLPGSGNTVKIGERNMVVLGDAAVMGVGFYEFRAGQARFTFVMVKRGNEWLIAHHHSSRLPEPPAPPR